MATARKPRKRNHSLYISFTVDKEPDYPMCIARLPEHFVTQVVWKKLLTTIAKHYKASAYNISGLDGLCDPPGFDPSLHPVYEANNKVLFPMLNKAFDGENQAFPKFELWAWNPALDKMELVRATIKEVAK